MRPLPGLLLVALVLVACSASDAGPVEGETAPEDVSVAETPEPEAPEDEAAAEPPPCRRDALDDADLVGLTGTDATAVAEQVVASTHACAATVVVAPADDTLAALLAIAVAAAEDAPLLLHGPEQLAATRSRLDDLGADDVLTIGMASTGLGRSGTAIVVPTEPSAPFELALLVAAHLDAERFLAVPDDADVWAAAATSAARSRPDARAVLPIPDDDEELLRLAEALPANARIHVAAGSPEAQSSVADRLLGVGLDAEPLGDVLWGDASSTTWLADPRQAGVFAAAAVAAVARGDAILPIDADDLRAGRERTDRIREQAPDRVVLVGDVTPDADWQLRLVRDGATLADGGFRLFEDERVVALYGHPGSRVLGALGEQDLDATVERLRAVAEPYGADGLTVRPAFEIITTIASAEAGELGDYSRRTPLETLRPWVERASDEGFLVILDLQPGRTDFLTQAKEYEELLREPHVGLALDPEWRLGPDQRHLRQIGSVDAEEVQQVADWLAALTREAGLPQKLLVLHQFRFSMLPDRDNIVAPPELAVVVHMDGQGPIGTKYETYGAITAGVEDRWLWGWKNFYDEDQPTPTPAQVLDLDPLPVLVTYQ
jgi:hypothetical protein